LQKLNRAEKIGGAGFSSWEDTIVARSPQPQLWRRLVSEYKRANIEHPPLKAVTLAQWALESGRGTSPLAKQHNNFGGLKFRDRMQGFAEPVEHPAHDGVDTYCKFTNPKSFIAGYWHFIDKGPYDGWKNFGLDPVGYIAHLKAKGYAGDPNYVAKVAALLPEAQAALDQEPEGGEPLRLARALLGDFVPPNFEHLQDITHAVQGTRPDGLEGLIVHFDAYRIRRAGNGPEDSDKRTIEMMRSGQQNGFHYGEISRTGRVFLAKNFDWKKWGFHAGASRCPLTGREGVSKFYVGFEMNNPGRLHPAQEPDVFCPWFNSKRTTGGAVILDAQGRCTRLSANDEWYRRDEVRLAEGGNIQKGWYLPYSHDQCETLTNIFGFLLQTFPASFSIDKVFGHDEVSPGRKNDPGGALATPDQLMTMAEFREFLKAKF
jgi:hypothetical protein